MNRTPPSPFFVRSIKGFFLPLFTNATLCLAVEPIKVLLVTGGGWHDYKAQQFILKEAIETRLHATIDIRWTSTEEHEVGAQDTVIPHIFTTDFARGYDVVFHNHCHTGFMDDAAIDNAIDAQLKHKVGIVLTHGSFHTFRKTPKEAWDRICGCNSTSHTHHTPLEVNLLSQAHPLIDLMGIDGWVTPNGELYETSMLPHTLSLAEATTINGRRTTQSCVFTHNLQDSRVVGITLGHHNETMQQPEFQELVALSVLWAAKKIDASGNITTGYRKPDMTLKNVTAAKRGAMNERIAELQAKLTTNTPALDFEQATWLKNVRKDPTWTPGKLLSTQKNGEQHIIEIAGPATAQRLTALRLDAAGEALRLSNVEVKWSPLNENAKLQGRYVRVDLRGDTNEDKRFLHLGEVQVFSNGENVALKGSASQSSTWSGCEAKRGIDGNTSGNMDDNSAFHTNHDPHAWWEVDLGAQLPLDKVVIWNRTDLPDRLRGWQMSVLDRDRQVVWTRFPEVPKKDKTFIPTPVRALRLLEPMGMNLFCAEPVQVKGGKVMLSFTLSGKVDTAEKLAVSTTTDTHVLAWTEMPVEIRERVKQSALNEADHEALEGYYRSIAPSLDDARNELTTLKLERANLRGKELRLKDVELADGVEASLFAAEPMVLNPTSIDIDPQGRVWVAEAVNYRYKEGVRPEGDRIVVLEDTDRDGRADTSTVFYQAKDFMSPHGVCVVGDGKVIVSVGESVLIMTDTDGDLTADHQEPLFTRVAKAQHDHGIHAFHTGPDGRLYFNYGNAGKLIHDKAGKVVIDRSGREVGPDNGPYKQGMAFRCNLDGSDFETLAWNARNPWEVNVDSFGNLFQSDNDDDGNAGCHISFLMEFSNTGYGAPHGGGWNVDYRHGMHADKRYRHYHQNDPGVVPYFVHYGAGSPTGIMIYEGDMLPKAFRGQVVHCEPRANVVRAYPRTVDGAGFKGTIANLIHSDGDRFLRPSDVTTGPDGSMFVADWHDSNVGGHSASKMDTGRIYRLSSSAAKNSYTFPAVNLRSVDGAIAALKSPNPTTQFQAHHALVKMGRSSESALLKLYHGDNAVYSARALWILVKLDARMIESGMKNPDPRLRVVAVRAARQHRVATPGFVRKHAKDTDPAVRRELAIALRPYTDTDAAEAWSDLALQHDGVDKWALEALGTGADGKWDRFLSAYLERDPKAVNRAAYHHILWRGSSVQHVDRLVELILDPASNETQLAQLFRTIDFLPREFDRGPLYNRILAGRRANHEKIDELLLRSLDKIDLEEYPELAELINSSVDKLLGTRAYVDLAQESKSKVYHAGLFAMATKEKYQVHAAAAAEVYAKVGAYQHVHNDIKNVSVTEGLRFIYGLSASTDHRAANPFIKLLRDPTLNPAYLQPAIDGAMGIWQGRQGMMKDALKEGMLSETHRRAVVTALSSDREAKDKVAHLAKQYASEAGTADKGKSMAELMQLTGDASAGKGVYASFCIACHNDGNSGIAFGPSLADIGSKSAKEALFESVLHPSAAVSFDYVGTVVKVKGKGEMVGIVTGKTETDLTLKLMGGASVQLNLEQIERQTKMDESLMPDIYKSALTAQQLADLIAYLESLKG